jgi:exonuclease III
MYSNVDQLLNKVEDLKVLITTNEPDIMLLTEVIPKAQKNEIHKAQITMPGYEKFVNFSFSEQQLGASG